ncbi:hypothetical protein E3J38_04860 [candidate division TA06 bacterium]|uniref:Outer membrane protein beta-barrel domain-containing protein n=1 Tax=candidate division TA06 bacterium TaxID=2250710 RepID=A0A523XNK6_UNCT6|nr:MAG: hypothetical protein E3J38_04860 [candidate division TA06 bacterium]
MRRLMLVVLVVLLQLFVAEACFALPHGIFHRARTVDPGSIYGGGYIIIIDGDAFALMGQARMGVAPDFEAGGRLVFTSYEHTNDLTLGGDAQYLFYGSTKEFPANISGVGGIDLTFGEDRGAFIVTFGGLIDTRIKLKRGRSVCPYGGLLIIFTRSGSRGHTDLALCGGAVFQISQTVGIVSEIRLTPDFSIGVGLNFR